MVILPQAKQKYTELLFVGGLSDPILHQDADELMRIMFCLSNHAVIRQQLKAAICMRHRATGGECDTRHHFANAFNLKSFRV